MATESALDYDKLVRLVKSNHDIKQSEVAERLGLSLGQVTMIKFCQAQVEAGVYNKVPGTAASIKKLRDSEGNRWELIAARTGKSVAAVKDLYPGDPTMSYTGRGRNFNESPATNSGRKPAARGNSKPAAQRTGRKPSGAKPSGSKPAGRKPSAAARTRASGQKPVVRRTTRRSTASNPS